MPGVRNSPRHLYLKGVYDGVANIITVGEGCKLVYKGWILNTKQGNYQSITVVERWSSFG